MPREMRRTVPPDLTRHRIVEAEIRDLLITLTAYKDSEAIMRLRALTEISAALTTDDLMDLTLQLVEASR